MTLGIGERLAHLRIGKGLSQQELADAIGKRRSQVADWERDALRPSADNLKLIAGALEVAPEEIGAPYDPEGPRAHIRRRLRYTGDVQRMQAPGASGTGKPDISRADLVAAGRNIATGVAEMPDAEDPDFQLVRAIYIRTKALGPGEHEEFMRRVLAAGDIRRTHGKERSVKKARRR